MYITLSIYINNKKHNKFCYFSYNIFSQKKEKFHGKMSPDQSVKARAF